MHLIQFLSQNLIIIKDLLVKHQRSNLKNDILKLFKIDISIWNICICKLFTRPFVTETCTQMTGCAEAVVTCRTFDVLGRQQCRRGDVLAIESAGSEPK